MKLKEIINALETFAPIALQEHYDNSGLITGNPESEVSGALLCLDATEEVIQEAASLSYNLVLAHHPIVFSGLKKITGKTYVERTVIKAIKNDIAIYAAHTNLDNVENGVNRKICDRLGLKKLKILAPLEGQIMKLFTFAPHDYAEKIRSALFAAGGGTIGNYDECSFNVEGYGTFRGSDQTNPFAGKPGERHREPETKIEVIFPKFRLNTIISALKATHPYEEVAYDVVSLTNSWGTTGAGMVGELEQPMKPLDFFRYLKDRMKVSIIRHTDPEIRTNEGRPGEIMRVAVCGGAGSFLLRNAIAEGADVFITSDFRYHQFFDAEGRIIIADIGHYESEQFTMEIFGEVLSRNFPNFAVRFTSINTNPIKYF